MSQHSEVRSERAMELTQHPEYHTYVRDRETAERCQQAIAAWQASGEPFVVEEYSLGWTFAGAQALARSLSCLFQEYNRVLWERFPYCRQCGGRCCVVDASHVGLFDSIALALLDRSLPTLPERIEATAHDCIYHAANVCVLPVEWRTVKCWSFYCALGERHNVIAEELAPVVLNLLPDALRRYEVISGDPLIAHLGDPVDFADAVGNALFAIFVAPFDARYPVIDEQSLGSPAKHVAAQDILSLDDDGLAFIAEAAEQVRESPPSVPAGLEISPDQLLADLELLEWIMLGHPGHGAKLLEEMYPRYAHAPAPRKGERATIGYRMRHHILHLWNNWD
jgi:hypothetical protein